MATSLTLFLALCTCVVGVVPGEDCVLPVPQPWALFGPSPANQPQELSRIPAEKYTKCVTQCCHHSEGLCNVATFKPPRPGQETAAESNCILYHCDVIRGCHVALDDGFQVFADTEVVKQALDNKSTAEPPETSVAPPPSGAVTEKPQAGGGPDKEEVPKSTSQPPIEPSEGTEASAGDNTEPGTSMDLVDSTKNVTADTPESNMTSSLPKATPDSKGESAEAWNASKEDRGEGVTAAVSEPVTEEESWPPNSSTTSSNSTTSAESPASSQDHRNENDTESITNVPESATAERNVSASSGNDATKSKSSEGTEKSLTASSTTADVSSTVSSSTAARHTTPSDIYFTYSHSSLQLPDVPSIEVTPDPGRSRTVAPNSTASSATSDGSNPQNASDSSINPTPMNSTVSQGESDNATDSIGSNPSTPQNTSISTNDSATTRNPSPTQEASHPVLGTETEDSSTESSSGISRPSEEGALQFATNSSIPASVAEATTVSPEGLGWTGSGGSPPASNASAGVAAGAELEGGPETTEGNETASSSDHGDILAVQPLSTTVVLILALTIGCFFFFVALVIVGKRLFDGWKKRHYSRIERDYLIDGMYSE